MENTTETVKKYLNLSMTVDEMIVNLDMDYDRLMSLLNPENRYVLQINDDGVDSLEHGVGEPLRLAVKRVDGEARLLVAGGGDLVVEDAADAVLGAEEGDELHARGIVQQIDRGLAVARAAGVIGQEADALALEASEAFANENVDAGQDGQGCRPGRANLGQT